jgi:hypothetical protein
VQFFKKKKKRKKRKWRRMGDSYSQVTRGMKADYRKHSEN